MHPHLKIARSLALLIPLVGALTAATAGAVTLTCGSGSGLAGQSVDVSISTSDLTGLNVRSYQFEIAYTANQVTATNVVTSGTLTGTAGWSNVAFNVTSGKITVSAAGISALSGAGTLIKITF